MSLNDVPQKLHQPTQVFEKLASGEITLSDMTVNDSIKRWQRLLGLPAYYWLLIAQILVIVPHGAFLPIWLIILGVISVIAQLPRFKSDNKGRKWLYRLIQLSVFIGGLFGLGITYGVSFSVDLGVAFLLLCLISKLWELYKRRDAYVILNLSLFVLAALFLMDQGAFTAIQVLLGTSAVMMSFIAIHDEGNLEGKGRLRSFGLLAGLALPLMIVLFIFFPRLPPLWSLQLASKQPTTGMSDSMSPGDFANLSQSTELAFRVEFEGDIPPQSQLYWRGLVFSDFDGVAWTQNPAVDMWIDNDAPAWMNQAWSSVPEMARKSPLVYNVVLEPTNQSWVYGLDYPYTQEREIRISSNFTLARREPVSQKLRYQAMQLAGMKVDRLLSNQLRRMNLALPSQGNPQARQYAKKMLAQTGNDPKAYIAAIQNWITTESFHYTLSPPPLRDNRIDEFLFKTKAGFCEHYASSFTFMMRAAGIPARVVAGYQGGERGRDGTSWEVRQMDAHAWSEVWLEGEGWVRVDPTSFVASQRVEQGMDALTSQQGAAMFGSGASAQLSYQQFKMLQQLRRLSDQASYYWHRDIVGYDQEKQSSSLLKWFNIKTVMQQVLWMAIGVAVLILGVITLLWYRRRKHWHVADLPIVKLSERLAKVDPELKIESDEGVLSWLQRLQDYTDDTDIIQRVQNIKQDYRRLRYGKLSRLDTKATPYQTVLKQLYTNTKLIK